MDFSNEWKSIFPINGVFEAPLLFTDRSVHGPLCFNPKPHTSTPLLSSSSLCPPLLNLPPSFSLSRFLVVGGYPHCTVPLSTASSVASLFGPQTQKDAASVLAHNRLQLLNLPSGKGVLVFFPTGLNADQVGCMLVCVKDGRLVTVENDKDGIFTAEKQLGQRIVRILVNPVEGDSLTNIGYLLVYSMYSVSWFSVKFIKNRPFLEYIGCRVFKSCVVSACWSPHLVEECVVLLENGALFVFDVESDCSGAQFRGTRLKVLWDETVKIGKSQHTWLGCEFSWHPRILIVVRSDAAFLVDWRYDEFSVSCLAKIDMFGVYAPFEKERFLAISKVVSDLFHFVLVTDSMLVICDVRKPFNPVLQWKHGLEKPCYVDVFRLSDLRSNSKENTYELVNASGFGIILGSFWNGSFSVCCYGPSLPAHKGSVVEEVPKFSKSFYAWELPSDLPLSGNECQCGSCLVREEFAKGSLPEWVDWQQKKDMVLGFGILSSDLSSLLFEQDEFGGFTLIRLMSSGKLESQRYYASWDLVGSLGLAHRDTLLRCEENLLYSKDVGEYKFPKRFKYLKLDYLYAYLNGNLSQVLDENTLLLSKKPIQNDSFSLAMHEVLCKKLKVCGFGRSRVSPAIRVVFNDINLPTSIREVAFKRIWASLPIELLQLAFSSYTEFQDILLDQKKMPLEFLAVPDLPQLPPYILRNPSNRSSRWTQRVQQRDSPVDPSVPPQLVGPLVPLPVLITLHEFLNGCPNSQEASWFSSDMEIASRCSEVVQVARELAFVDSKCDLRDSDENAISLSDDSDDMQLDSEKPKSFYLYQPIASQDSSEDDREDKQRYKDNKFACLISKLHDKEVNGGDKVKFVSQEVFDDICPINLKFGAAGLSFSSGELKIFDGLKKRFAVWQKEFEPYQAFCSALCAKKDARC